MSRRRRKHSMFPKLGEQDSAYGEKNKKNVERTKQAWLPGQGTALARVAGGCALQLVSATTSIYIFTDSGGTCYFWTGMALTTGLMLRTHRDNTEERYSHVFFGALLYFLFNYLRNERFSAALVLSTALCNAMGQVVGDHTMRRVFPSTPLSHREVQRLDFLTSLLLFPVLLGSVVASVPGSLGFYVLGGANFWEVFTNYGVGHIAGTMITLYPALVLPALWKYRQPLQWRLICSLAAVALMFTFSEYGVFQFAAAFGAFCVVVCLSCTLDQWNACLMGSVVAALMLGFTVRGRGPFLCACRHAGVRDAMLSAQLGVTAVITCSAFVCVSLAKLRSVQTSDKSAREEREQIFESQTAQLCRVGHDLLNNATLIGGLSESVTDSLPETGRVKDMLMIIQAVVDMNRSLMRDMVDSLRPTGRPCTVHRTNVDLRAFMGVHLHLADVLLRKANKNIKAILEMDSADGTITLFTDRDRLHQVLSNLVGNAVKYTVSGSILLRVTRRGSDDGVAKGSIVIQVTDTGVGIDAEGLPKVFGNLFRCPRATEIASGIGIGLSSVYNSCELLGAKVTAESPGIDQGSTFSIEFSNCSCPDDGRSSSDTPFHNHPEEDGNYGRTWRAPAGFRALVVDDSHTIREMMKKYLTEVGCRVVSLESYEKVKEHLRHDEATDVLFDVVVTDLFMGKGRSSGKDLLADIRSGRLSGIARDTPCILCSGLTTPLECCDNTFLLMKPFTRWDVSHALGALVGR